MSASQIQARSENVGSFIHFGTHHRQDLVLNITFTMSLLLLTSIVHSNISSCVDVLLCRFSTLTHAEFNDIMATSMDKMLIEWILLYVTLQCSEPSSANGIRMIFGIALVFI